MNGFIKPVFLIVLSILLLVGIVIFKFYYYHLIFETRVDEIGTNIKYTDTKYDFSFSYPKTWERSIFLTGSELLSVGPPNDPNSSIEIGPVESGKLGNIEELRKFVEQGAKDDQKKSGSETESIEKKIINGRETILWKHKRVSNTGTNYFQQYYFADYHGTDPLINAWVVAVVTVNKTEPSEKDKILDVLNSFTPLK